MKKRIRSYDKKYLFFGCYTRITSITSCFKFNWNKILSEYSELKFTCNIKLVSVNACVDLPPATKYLYNELILVI